MKNNLLYAFCLLLLAGDTAWGQITLRKQDESCADRKDGQIEVLVEGTSGSLQYQWTRDGQPFPGGKIISGLGPGDYKVTVSTTGGCMGTKAAKIWPGRDVSVDIAASLLDVTPDPLGCGERPYFTYRLDAVIGGGTSPYYCSWGESVVGTPTSGGGEGDCYITVGGHSINQSLTVIDSNGCVDSDGFKITGTIKVCPRDPNDITGPAGHDTARWVSVRTDMNYAVRFENDPIFATSNAAVVFVTVPIDDDIDPFSFRLGTMGFGDKIIEVPANVSFFQQRLDYSQDLGFLLDVTAGLDLPNNRFFWLLETIDPVTGQPPSDPTAGFLPVNDTLTGSGEGFINFLCKPKSATLTGETIDHQASIIFDLNDPLLTNTWSNTIDAFAPTTIPVPMADTLYHHVVSFEFNAMDDPGGCGVQYTQIFLSTDNSIFHPNGLLTETDSIALPLNWGTWYYYKIVSTDFVDQQETIASDSFYIIPAREIEFLAPVQNVFCLGDSLEIDVYLNSLDHADLYMSQDSGLTYVLLEGNVSDWPYTIATDSSMLLDTIFFKARNETFDIEAVSIPVTLRPLPLVDAGDAVDGCEDEVLFVEATGANEYRWWPDTIFGQPAGRYSNVYADVSQWARVDGTDAYGCTSVDSVWVQIHPMSMDTLPQPLCEGDSILIDGVWIHEEGFYPVIYSDLNGCDSILVTQVFFESPCIWPGGLYVYVDTDAAGDNNGTSWADAFTDLNDAIYVAGRYENVQEIWVAEGIYSPHPTRRDTSFILLDSIRIYGGFIGVETDRSQRTSNAELVQISGDINLPDTLWDNSYHTIILTSACEACVLDGLTITYGQADASMNNQDIGAGVLNAGTGHFYNVIFERNYATQDGSALHTSGSSAHLIIENCIFRLNTSNLGRDVVNLSGAEIEFRGANMIQQ